MAAGGAAAGGAGRHSTDSQGGIDSRRVVAGLGYADRMASLVTISSPHRGIPLADSARYLPSGAMNVAGRFFGWLLGALDGDPPAGATWLLDDTVQGAYDPDLASAVGTFRTDAMAAFNAAHPDPDDVPIFSVAGVSNLRSLDHPACADSVWGFGDRVDAVNLFFAGSGAALSLTERGTLFDPNPNDGLVTARSARWATFLGCVPADHADAIGQIALQGPGLISGWDHRVFYTGLLDQLRDVERAEPVAR